MKNFEELLKIKLKETLAREGVRFNDGFESGARWALSLCEDKVSSILSDLMKEQEEVISSPIRFNGVHIEKIKEVFEKIGIKYDVGF